MDTLHIKLHIKLLMPASHMMLHGDNGQGAAETVPAPEAASDTYA